MRIVRDLSAFPLGDDVGLVPTMGALHAGHRALFRAAREENDTVVASVFVNAAQFDQRADLAAYPRDEARDAEVAEAEGVDVLFAPSSHDMYPPGFGTWVDVDHTGAEGDARPGHFRGVATICVKLFNIVRPQRAYFGQKDAQQVAVIKRAVRDLNLPVQIRVVPTIRDADGLAFSSRNVRLSPEEREQALALPRALATGANAYTQGTDAVRATLESFNGLTPDYVELIDIDGVVVLAAALKVGEVRLIDNMIVKGELS